VALAARAALELRDSAGIPSTTLARLLGQLDDGQPSPVAPGAVLVVDEAGMVGTRQLARLLDHAQRLDVKVVLVGDPHQLPEIDAGGLFRTLATRLPAVELTDNRRQQHVWEQAALDELRHGDPDAAVAAYRQHGRIITADTAEAVREQLVTDWWDTYRQAGAKHTVMVALRRGDVDDLNHRARAQLLQAGQLTGPTLDTGDIAFRAGDRIVCLRNNRRLRVVNGTRATITRIDPLRRTIHTTGDDGIDLQLDTAYVEAGHVAHGYAITGHKAQGLTVDHTFVLGSAELYREWGYVALSRGRDGLPLKSVLRAEVREQPALGHLHPLRERADGHARQAHLARELDRRIQDGLPGDVALAHASVIARSFVSRRTATAAVHELATVGPGVAQSDDGSAALSRVLFAAGILAPDRGVEGLGLVVLFEHPQVHGVAGRQSGDGLGAAGQELGTDAGAVVDYVPHLADVAGVVADRVRPGDLVLITGAGDVTHVGPALLALLEAGR
jgi:hypothetical protein